eukprot:CAMPEP_0115044968 /NCGR_PEP_ID=MMETSP0216-20121206/47854_1 /TAXON_ID=223996 /ORGANISM="Protocruzia adherens, Strain Boccale" /LENGTH=81 /DNA_ID=CAMNT_0002427729 /DNA_START=168 /DNA_END=413 /DNA_ORIENTATION=-
MAATKVKKLEINSELETPRTKLLHNRSSKHAKETPTKSEKKALADQKKFKNVPLPEENEEDEEDVEGENEAQIIEDTTFPV